MYRQFWQRSPTASTHKFNKQNDIILTYTLACVNVCTIIVVWFPCMFYTTGDKPLKLSHRPVFQIHNIFECRCYSLNFKISLSVVQYPHWTWILVRLSRASFAVESIRVHITKFHLFNDSKKKSNNRCFIRP